MTITKPQAQLLTTLALACRPLGAARWDSAGVMAAIGKVADRSLPEVAMAVVRAASDKAVDSPGVIPSAGPHWQESAAVRGYVPNVSRSDERCSVCSERKDRCRRIWSDDHDFETDAMAARRKSDLDPEALHAAAIAVRDGIEVTEPPTPRPTLDDLAASDPQLHERVEALRVLSQPMRETETEEPMTVEVGMDERAVAG